MPVWPICFWSCWPTLALAAIRLPAASTPMSCMVTPPSARAPRAASEARSIVSLSGCLPNLVIVIPRIQTSSAMSVRLLGAEPEPDGFRAGTVDTDGERREPDLHAQPDVFRSGLRAHDVAPHAGPVAVDHGGHERHGDARRGHGHDGERLYLALRGHPHLAEVGSAARRTGVATIEEASAA